jgi:hypothetical protein
MGEIGSEAGSGASLRYIAGSGSGSALRPMRIRNSAKKRDTKNILKLEIT